MNTKLSHWIVMSETEAYELIGLFHRIGCTTITHFINDEHYLYGFNPPAVTYVTFYVHKVYGDTDGYVGTLPHKIYHIQRRILKYYFNLLYVAHIDSPGLAEQQFMMSHMKELMSEEDGNVHQKE